MFSSATFGFCSGQSNMEFGVANSSTAKDAIATANYPEIRLMRIPNVVARTPQPSIDVPSNGYEMKWQVCSPDTVGTGGWGGFSAVGYFFGRHLYNSLKVPIGLIQNSWSGMPAESFVSRGTLSELPAYKERIDILSTTLPTNLRSMPGTRQISISGMRPTILVQSRSRTGRRRPLMTHLGTHLKRGSIGRTRGLPSSRHSTAFFGTENRSLPQPIGPARI